jgi:hypothetical protein
VTELNKEVEKMIDTFTDFLNAHAVVLDEPQVFRDFYDDYEDPPKVYIDYTLGDSLRTIQIYAHPFHDEGGPNILTGFFRNYDSPPNWELDTLVQDFDATHSILLLDGKHTDAWPDD